MIHRKDLEGEWREPEISGEGHLEELDRGEDRDAHVAPPGERPVVPELPQEPQTTPATSHRPDESPDRPPATARNDGRPARAFKGSRRRTNPSHTNPNVHGRTAAGRRGGTTTKTTPTATASRSPAESGTRAGRTSGVGKGPAPSSAAVSKSAGQIVAKAQA